MPKTEQKNVFHARTKLLKIKDWEELIAIVNEQDAREYWINAFDKIELVYNWNEKIVVNADLTNDDKIVKPGQIGIFKDIYEKFHIAEGESVWVSFTKNSLQSVEAIKKKLTGGKLNYDEIYAIIKDISENKLTDTLITYYVASSFLHETTNEEMYQTAKAMAETGVTFHYPEWSIVADKHCIGWVPGNETSMIMIPTLASLGIKMPKNFSKAITSPAATGECVSVLMDIEFDKPWIEKLIEENNCCLIRGWALDLAPADDKIIRVSYPLSLQNIAKVVSSIMAKKYAMGITHSLIDIPMWPTAKVPDLKTALERKKKFEYVGKKLWMKMCVEITKADQPIWAGIWATLQVREVLRVLQQHPLRPLDLEEKALHLCVRIIEIVWMARWKKALEIAKKELVSWKAWNMMKKIIKTQRVQKKDRWILTDIDKINSENLPTTKIIYQYKSKKSGKIIDIDMKILNNVTRTLWSPLDLEAGIYLDKKVSNDIKNWELLCTLYTNDQKKLKMAIDIIENSEMYKIE